MQDVSFRMADYGGAYAFADGMSCACAQLQENADLSDNVDAFGLLLVPCTGRYLQMRTL